MRVRLELALAFYLKEDDALARDHFERALVGRPPAALVANINRFLNIMRARRRWRGYFGFSVAPDTNINAASDAQFIYINGLPFRRGTRRARPVRISAWWAGAAGNTSIRWPSAGACARGSNLNHREYKGSRFDQTFLPGLRGAALADQPEYRNEPAGLGEPALVGRLQPFNYDFGARLEVEHRVFAGLRLSGRATWEDRTYQQNRSSWKGRSWCFPWARPTCSSPPCRSTPWSAIRSRIPGEPLGQCRVLDAGGDERGVAVGLYRGRQRRVPVDGLRGGWFPFIAR